MSISTSEDLGTCLDRLEHGLGRIRVLDMTIIWDDNDKPPTVSFSANFQMLDIERALTLHVFGYILDFTI